MRASLCPAAGHTPHPIVNKSLEPMPGSSSAAPPPIRDAALDDIAQLAAELTGLEAAALWLASGAGAPPRWGAFGVPIQASQLPALAPLAQPGAAADAAAAVGDVDVGGTGDGGSPVEALDTLHRGNLCKPGVARPGIDSRGLVARIDGKTRNP